MSTYQTDISTWQMRTVQGLIIAGSLLTIAGNIYKYASGMEYSLLNLFSGFCFLFMGIFFPRLFKGISITIDPEAIRNYYPATRFESAREERSKWRYINKIVLNNYSVRVDEKMRFPSYGKSLTKKFRLPYYTNSQFQQIKSHLQKLAKENDVTFEVKSWW